MQQKKLSCVLITLFAPVFLANTHAESGQKDSLRIYNLNEVVVSATKIPQPIIGVPQRIEVIPLFRLHSAPALSSDDVLNQISGINLRRTMGILSRKTLVSVRGMGNEQGRTLILIDGVPVNKASTGSVNLNQINPDLIERIEVVKGPGSSLYGGNAMGGIVNMVTRKAHLTPEGSVGFLWGEMGTIAAKAALSGKRNGLSGYLNGFYQKSNGYNSTPPAERSEETIRSFLNEFGLSATLGYDISTQQMLEGNFQFYNGKRGDGSRYFFADPEKESLDLYNRYKEYDYRLIYRGDLENMHWTLSGSFGQENYLEKKAKGSSLYDVACIRRDWHVRGDGYGKIGENNLLSMGIEVKGGYVNGKDVYQSSTDIVIDRGKSTLFGVWLQDEISLLDNKIRIIPSLRYDYARIHDGGFFIEGGTAVTEIYMPFTGKLRGDNWHAISPKVCLQYQFNESDRIFANTGWGFRPGNLEDMVRTGPVQGGVVLANTALKPEHINTTEVGGDFSFLNVFTLSPSFYYSSGRDFIYNVNTGETILMGKKERPIFRKENIARVEILGAEADLNGAFSDQFNMYVNYSYTRSKIKKGTASISGVETDLKGNNLTYTPRTKICTGATWRPSIVNVNVAYVQYGKQYINDLNTEQLPAFGTVDAKIWRTFYNSLTLSLNGKNLFNRRVNDNGMMSIGRLLFIEMQFRF